MLKAGLILAGGKSSRMGANKALIRLKGKAVVARVAEALLEVVEDVVVATSAQMDPEAYRRVLPAKVRVVADKMRISSPLVGIVSGLSEFPQCYCAILSCDLPLVSPKVLSRLFEEAEGYDAAVPQWPRGRIEPLHSVYGSGQAQEAAKKALEVAEFSNRDMVKRLRRVNFVPTEVLRFLDPDLLTFFNMNSLSDLERVKGLLGRSR